jgi:DNA-binding Xre family transcriptional regulator
MLTLNLKPIFKARGIERPFTFLTKAGFPSYTAHNLLNGKTISFQLRNIDKLCSLLNCTPNDLLLWTPNKNEKLPNDPPLTSLKNQNIDYNWQDTIKTLPLNQLQQLVSTIKSTKTSNTAEE